MADDLSDDELVDAWALIIQGFQRTRLRLVRDLDVTVAVPESWFEVMLRLHRTPGGRLTMNRMAVDMTMTSGGFTKLADRMVDAGLLRRSPSADDRRVTYVELTPQGDDLAAKSVAEHIASLRERVLGVVNADRLATLSGLMRELRDANADGD